MSGIRNYYLWCPDWDPGTPPPIEDQIISYRDNEIYSTRTWNPAMCTFTDETGRNFRQGQGHLSTNEEVRRVRDAYRCVRHNTRPEVFRQHAAWARRRSDRINQVSQLVSFNQRPDLIPDGYTITDYRRWTTIVIPRRPNPVTTHTTWATS